MARLTEYDYDLCVEICDLVANGSHIIDALNSNDNYPSWSTFRRWKSQSKFRNWNLNLGIEIIRKRNQENKDKLQSQISKR